MDKKKEIVIVKEIDPEDITKKKRSVTSARGWNEKTYEDDHTGDDLDIPGSELDDVMEEVGSEDEENNYYSVGGDRHHELEEG